MAVGVLFYNEPVSSERALRGLISTVSSNAVASGQANESVLDVLQRDRGSTTAAAFGDTWSSLRFNHTHRFTEGFADTEQLCEFSAGALPAS